MEKQKQSLYFPEETLREITREANRLDRSLSWTVQQAWRLAREEIKKLPGTGWAGAARGDPAVAPPPEPRTEDPAASAQVREFLRGKFDRELTG
jgi:uncharacterized small protein (TIGR04563 family)